MPMDKIIVTVMLIIGGVVASFAIFNGVYPAVERGGQAVSDSVTVVSDRIRSQVEIIHAAGSNSTVDAWVKNVGTSQIGAIQNSDVFFGRYGELSRIPYGDEGSALPYWTYQLEGNYSFWGQSVTNRITINLEEPLPQDNYWFKIVLPNGISSQTSFSME